MKRTDSYSYKSVSFIICDLLNKGSVWLLYAALWMVRMTFFEVVWFYVRFSNHDFSFMIYSLYIHYILLNCQF